MAIRKHPQPTRNVDVVVLCSQSLNEFQRSVVDTLLPADGPNRIVGCVIDARPVPSLWQRAVKNFGRGRGGYVLIMALKRMRRSVSAAANSAALFGRLNVPVVRTEDLYSAETIQAIRDMQPGVLVLIGGFGIVRPPLLDLAPHGILSYHHGDMREYRGQPPGFWELYNGERRIGVTVQRLSQGIDCGQTVVERSFRIRRTDTLRSLTRTIFAGSADMMMEALRRLEDPSLPAETLTSVGRLYTLPNLKQWCVLHAKVGWRVLAARFRCPRRQDAMD
jgi:folate-dependent phosphoribosylglycinamide formyltransferase PurN